MSELQMHVSLQCNANVYIIRRLEIEVRNLLRYSYTNKKNIWRLADGTYLRSLMFECVN